MTGDLDATFGLSTSGGRVSGLDTAVSGFFGSHGVFSHHDVTTAMRDQAREALKRVEAPHLAAKPLNEMSTGERRRVLIARALVTRPDALVLDEPTTGLDLVARHRFMETVRRLMREGTTLILITHHVDEIVPETKRVVLLRDGQVSYDGTPEDALTPVHLSQTFGANLTVERAGDYYHVRVTRDVSRTQLSDAYAEFLARYPQYQSTLHLDALRAVEYGRLDEHGHVYLDYTGASLHAASQVRQHADLLNAQALGNPHSASPSSSRTTTLVEGARRAVLEWFDARRRLHGNLHRERHRRIEARGRVVSVLSQQPAAPERRQSQLGERHPRVRASGRGSSRLRAPHGARVASRSRLRSTTCLPTRRPVRRTCLRFPLSRTSPASSIRST